MASEPEAVAALTELGLSEYEAQCFVALTQLSDGTAKEISQIADVPQSRVYDVTERLAALGLVDIQRSDPRRYHAVPVTHALKSLREKYDATLATASDHLEELEGRETERAGVWEIARQDDVSIRVDMLIDRAENEVYLLVAHGELLEDALLETLVSAAERGATVMAEVPTGAARQTVHSQLPEAHVTVTDVSDHRAPMLDQHAGRLLMVDRETVLLSTRKEGLVPGDREECGIWGSALGHGLVVWIQQLLDARRDRLEFATATG